MSKTTLSQKEILYTNKPCICGAFLPYGFNQSQICFSCIEAGVKISGFISSGKVSIKHTTK